MIIQPIVEGQGDEAAVPLLLRRLRDEAQAWGLEVGRPHRKRRTQLVKKDSLQSAVSVAALRENCAAILVLFDADDDGRRLTREVRRDLSGVAAAVTVLDLAEIEPGANDLTEAVLARRARDES